jgi:hypothetical protein
VPRSVHLRAAGRVRVLRQFYILSSMMLLATRGRAAWGAASGMRRGARGLSGLQVPSHLKEAFKTPATSGRCMAVVNPFRAPRSQ